MQGYNTFINVVLSYLIFIFLPQQFVIWTQLYIGSAPLFLYTLYFWIKIIKTKDIKNQSSIPQGSKIPAEWTQYMILNKSSPDMTNNWILKAEESEWERMRNHAWIRTTVWKQEWSCVRKGGLSCKARTLFSTMVHSTSSSWITTSFFNILTAYSSSESFRSASITCSHTHIHKQN